MARPPDMSNAEWKADVYRHRRPAKLALHEEGQGRGGDGAEIGVSRRDEEPSARALPTSRVREPAERRFAGQLLAITMGVHALNDSGISKDLYLGTE